VGCAMSVKALRWARRQRAGSLSTKAVLLVLAEYADDQGMCWPSTRTLADDCETDQRTVRRLLERLRETGLIAWDAGPGRRSNVYRLAMRPTVVTEGPRPSQDVASEGSGPSVMRGHNPHKGSEAKSVVRGHAPQGEGSGPSVVRGQAPLNRKRTTREPKKSAAADASNKTPIPPDWQPHHGHELNARRRGVDLAHEAAQYRAHALANDRRLVDWDAGFDGWLGNARPTRQPGSSLLPAQLHPVNGRPATTTLRVRQALALMRPEDDT
jgi:hypothetical protein